VFIHAELIGGVTQHQGNQLRNWKVTMDRTRSYFKNNLREIFFIVIGELKLVQPLHTPDRR
jgi:hypothetical protein